MVLCSSLAAALGGVACGSTSHGEPAGTPGEVSESGASGDASRGGASSNGSGGAQAQAGTTGLGGQPVLIAPVTELGGSTSEPQEPAPTPHAAFPCDNPQPFALGGGYLVCEDQSLRIGERTACPTVLPRESPTLPLFFEECALDIDCTASANGFCAYGQCKYGCVTDDDCGGGLCFCGPEIGTCVSANCNSDADCPADYPCTGNHPFGYDTATFRCQTPLDTCESDYDCPGARVHCVVDLSSEVERRVCIRDKVG